MQFPGESYCRSIALHRADSLLIGKFHIGVPENGLGAGLVQAKDQTERGIAYRFYVEQAASQPGFLGACTVF